MPTGIIIMPTKLKYNVLLFLLTICGGILILKAKVACQKHSVIRNFTRKKSGNVLVYCSSN